MKIKYFYYFVSSISLFCNMVAMSSYFYSIVTPPPSRIQSRILSPVTPDSAEQVSFPKPVVCERITLDFVHREKPHQSFNPDLARAIERRAIILSEMRRAAKYDADGDLWTYVAHAEDDLEKLRQEYKRQEERDMALRG